MAWKPARGQPLCHVCQSYLLESRLYGYRTRVCGASRKPRALEIRRPKLETRKKAEIRKPNLACSAGRPFRSDGGGFGTSDFGLLSAFGLRVSALARPGRADLARQGRGGGASVGQACCCVIAPALLRYCEPVGPLGIPCTTLVHPLFIPCTSLFDSLGFGSVSPVSSLRSGEGFGRNRIFPGARSGCPPRLREILDAGANSA